MGGAKEDEAFDRLVELVEVVGLGYLCRRCGDSGLPNGSVPCPLLNPGLLTAHSFGYEAAHTMAYEDQWPAHFLLKRGQISLPNPTPMALAFAPPESSAY